MCLRDCGNKLFFVFGVYCLLEFDNIYVYSILTYILSFPLSTLQAYAESGIQLLTVFLEPYYWLSFPRCPLTVVRRLVGWFWVGLKFNFAATTTAFGFLVQTPKHD